MSNNDDDKKDELDDKKQSGKSPLSEEERKKILDKVAALKGKIAPKNIVDTESQSTDDIETFTKSANNENKESTSNKNDNLDIEHLHSINSNDNNTINQTPLNANSKVGSTKITFIDGKDENQISTKIIEDETSTKGKSKGSKEARPEDKTKYVKVQVEDEMKKSFISYAMAVNVSRAIPDVRDGLKPVHRRILYSMGELNLYADKQYRKCARIVGDVLGKYHPHGDSAVYQALVRLAQPFSIRYPLVDGHGNFGSVDGDPAAAQRYTEAKLTKIAGELLRDIDKETVDFYPNFDDTLEQPSVLPSRIPNLLVNGSDGIAVGMATNIPPHNLIEVINGLFALIQNPDISIDELMQYIPAPDYPTGGIIMGRQNIRHAYKTGHGGVVVRAKCEIEEYGRNKDGQGGKQRIVVTELPFQVNKAQLIEYIAEMVKDKKIEGIANVNDESDRDGLRMVIEIKRDAQASVVLNTLYKHTNLQISNGITFLALVNAEPKILNLKEMLYYYLEHQKEVIVRRTKYELEKAEERSHILEGLVKALANIDRVIQIIKQSRDKFEASEKLTVEFYLTDKQANAILEMRLSRLTSLEVEKLQQELADLQLLISDLKNILATPQRVLDIIIAELSEIQQKYGDERKSEIQIDYNEINIADMIDVEDVVISMTHYGYIKRFPTSEYRAQKRGGKGSTAHKPKEEDFVENMFVASTHSDILFFTNFGRVYSIKGYEIPEAQKTARGRAIVNLLQMQDGEKVTAIIPLGENPQGYLIMATRNGRIKKSAIEHFSRINKNGKIAITFRALNSKKSDEQEDDQDDIDDQDDQDNEQDITLQNNTIVDELISVQLTNGRDEILMASSEGKCIRFGEDRIKPQGRTSSGVIGIRLAENHTCVDMTIIKPGCEILTISENGYGKVTEISDATYRITNRGGKGIKAGTFNEKTGRVAHMKQISSEDDIMVIADNGIIIRLRAKDISKTAGRATMGVRIMNTAKSGGKVVGVAVAPPYEEIAENEASE